jgi:hypothetical protein
MIPWFLKKYFTKLWRTALGKKGLAEAQNASEQVGQGTSRKIRLGP